MSSSPPTHHFLTTLDQIIEEHLDDADFNSAQLADAMGMHRSQLHRKLKALTGQSTSLYLRSYRLQHARNLLLTTGLNITEVAWDTGFDSLSWFDQAYQQEFQETPGETRS